MSDDVFAGAGFGELMAQFSAGPKESPSSASQRALLRGLLPPVYQDGDFGMRFVGALEELLDPVAALLDNLAAHFDPRLAPSDIVALLAAWLGVDLDETQDLRRQREVVARSSEVTLWTGTRRGLELELRLAFPDLPLRVEDGGRTAGAERADDLPPPGRSEVVVFCDRPVEHDVAAAVFRRARAATPAHVGVHLRVKDLNAT